MDRRAFLGTLTGGLLAAPLAAEAQEAAKVARIGYLAAHVAANARLHEAFREAGRAVKNSGSEAHRKWPKFEDPPLRSGWPAKTEWK